MRRAHPWFIIMNGGAANLYEFFVDLKNRPGWAQYLAPKARHDRDHSGQFQIWQVEQPIADVKRQPAYLLDRELSIDRYKVRNAIYTNSLILQAEAVGDGGHDGRHSADRPFDLGRAISDGL